ncbi:MAG: phosphoribosylformylglycinamidine cyclo-ligase [Gammaproteobacteria bacterium]|nr:phosphoribosylformylglycinamidine cyclo-ligase [Gammaproteobacteria bacterium]
MNKHSLSYRDAGVNIDAGDALIEAIKPIAERTRRPGWMESIGGFGGMFELPPGRFKEPVLFSGTDGVGTKLKLAIELNKHDTVGIDLVAMCVNDIVVCGAEPLFFLDYLATSQLRNDIAEQVIAGIGRGCQLAGAALIGGETAEMPGMYGANDYDIAGFCVGAVEKSEIIDQSRVTDGNVILGLASSGVHSNGFSLVHKVIESGNHSLSDPFAGSTLGETLLTPTRIYVRTLLALTKQVSVCAIAHITGGGLPGNIKRVIPNDLCAVLDSSQWQRPEIFSWLQTQGNIATDEMQRTFNCGIGMAIVVDKKDAQNAIAILEEHGETVFSIGHIETNDEQDVVIRS